MNCPIVTSILKKYTKVNHKSKPQDRPHLEIEGNQLATKLAIWQNSLACLVKYMQVDSEYITIWSR